MPCGLLVGLAACAVGATTFATAHGALGASVLPSTERRRRGVGRPLPKKPHVVIFYSCLPSSHLNHDATTERSRHALHRVSPKFGLLRGGGAFVDSVNQQLQVQVSAGTTQRHQKEHVPLTDGATAAAGDSSSQLRAGGVNRRGVPPAEALSRYPSLRTPGGLVRALDYLGTVSFAMSGTATAGMRGMNLLGCVVVGTLAATGGGTTRDLLLGQTPVFWLDEVGNR